MYNLKAENLEENKLYQTDNGIYFIVDKVFKNGKIQIKTTNHNKNQGFLEETTRATKGFLDRVFGPFNQIIL